MTDFKIEEENKENEKEAAIIKELEIIPVSTLEEVIKEKDILIYSINLKELSEEEYAKLENKTFIKGTPTMVYVKDGSVQSTKLVGNKSKEDLIDFLKNYEVIK